MYFSLHESGLAMGAFSLTWPAAMTIYWKKRKFCINDRLCQERMLRSRNFATMCNVKSVFYFYFIAGSQS